LIPPDFPQATLDQGKRLEGVSLQLMPIQTESVYDQWLVPTHERLQLPIPGRCKQIYLQNPVTTDSRKTAGSSIQSLAFMRALD
jgi:hypothetical protein